MSGIGPIIIIIIITRVWHYHQRMARCGGEAFEEL
jgi:hypothetical protein